MPKGVYVRAPRGADPLAVFPADPLFSGRVVVTEGCWEYQGFRDRRGYGRVNRSFGPPVLAHRYAWALQNGPVPDGLCVLHRCDNPPCCNPAHLFVGTHLDNTQDMHRKGRARNGRELLTHCLHGHPYDGVNSYIWTRSDGATLRACRACSHNRYLIQKRRRAQEQ